MQRRHLTGLLSALAALFVLTAGCDKSGAPSKADALPKELAKEQTQVFGKKVSELPDEGLVTHTGEPFKWSNFKGKPLIVSAIYTSCPMAKMCPLLTQKIAQVQQKMTQEAGIPMGEWQIVVFSFDPETDTPEMLREYADKHGLKLDNTTLVTGDPKTVKKVMDGIEIVTKPDGEGTLTHNMRTYVVSPGGTFTYGFRKANWDPKYVVKRLRHVAP